MENWGETVAFIWKRFGFLFWACHLELTQAATILSCSVDKWLFFFFPPFPKELERVGWDENLAGAVGSWSCCWGSEQWRIIISFKKSGLRHSFFSVCLCFYRNNLVPSMNQGQKLTVLSTPAFRTKSPVFVPRNVVDRRHGWKSELSSFVALSCSERVAVNCWRGKLHNCVTEHFIRRAKWWVRGLRIPDLASLRRQACSSGIFCGALPYPSVKSLS